MISRTVRIHAVLKGRAFTGCGKTRILRGLVTGH
jgi:hypothetical protein